MQCTFCDTPVSDGAIYCHQCGSLVSDAEGQAAVAGTMNDSAIRHLTELLREDAAGEFEIGRQLGRGGMAVVFLAKETKLDRQVAIKVLPPELTFGHGVERFMREAKTAAKLDHANIIPIYRIADGGKIFWYAMKFLEGQSLDQRLADTGPMPIDEVLELLTPVADALDYAHDQQVIHRDIKPANIMVDPRGRVVVTDFGIAKALTEGTLTASGSVIGTPYFMSPEQGMGKPVTGASDQYSVSVMAYRMLSGQLPFEGDSAIDILHKHCTAPPRPLNELRADLPEHIYQAIDKGLAKKAERRFSSVTAFVKALKEPSAEITVSDLETVSMDTPPSDESQIRTEVIGQVNETLKGKQDAQEKAGGKKKKSHWKPAAILGLVGTIAIGGIGALWLAKQGGAPEEIVADNPPDDSGASDSLGGGVQQAPGNVVAPAESAATEPEPPPTSFLTLTNVPAGATITIDGNRENGTEFELAPGVHTIRIQAAGYEPFVYEDSLIADERLRVAYAAARLVPVVSDQPAPPTAQPPGFLQIVVRPWANLIVNGQRFEEVFRHVDTLSAGEYNLQFEHPELNNVDTTVVIRSGEATVVRIQLSGTG